jgi:hypothetical protein
MKYVTPRGLFSPETFDQTVKGMNEACRRASSLRRYAREKPVLKFPLRVRAWLIERRAFGSARLIAGEQHHYGKEHLDRLSLLDRFQIHRLYRDYAKPGERHLVEPEWLRQAA